MNQLHRFLKTFIFVQLGACCGRVLFRYLDYVNHPEWYALRSAPWYTGILLTVMLTAGMVLLTFLAYVLVGYVLKKRQRAGEEDSLTEETTEQNRKKETDNP